MIKSDTRKPKMRDKKKSLLMLLEPCVMFETLSQLSVSLLSAKRLWLLDQGVRHAHSTRH